MIIFTIQFVLVSMIFFLSEYGKKMRGLDVPFNADTMDPEVTLLMQYASLLAVHISFQPRLGDVIERVSYIKNHPHKFEKITTPVAQNIIKFLVECSTELITILVIVSVHHPVDISLTFTGFMCIGQIDESYYCSLKDPLKTKIEKRNMELPLTNKEELDLDYNHKLIDRILFLIVKILNFFYDVFYFHLFTLTLFLIHNQVYGSGDSDLVNFFNSNITVDQD